MYRRFLNNNDYLRIITEDALSQMTRGKKERFSMAEEAAEASIIEYLTDNYMIEQELAVGKNLFEYNNQVSYPAGAHFYHDGKIYQALRSIAGIKPPFTTPYWNELTDYNKELFESATPYSQLQTYSPGQVVTFANLHFICMEYNGFDFNNIRLPGVAAWEKQDVHEWQANVTYNVWEAVSFKGKFYALLTTENIDLTVNPEVADQWGLIGTYKSDYKYELNGHDYVEYEGSLYIPVINPVADELKVGYNICEHDPRNSNIKKHMVQLALYELHKLISPNNISSARITDYETSIAWLRDANKMRINPNIPRKLDEEHKPVAEFATATYMRDYDPYKNPWQI